VNLYSYNVELPFTKNKINFREISTQDQISLAKSNLSNGNDLDSLYEYFILSKTLFEQCIKEKEILNKITVIEYVLFLVKLRMISVGLNIEFLLKNETSQKTKIKIELKTYLKNLYEIGKFFENDENQYVFDKNILIKLNWPRVNSIQNFKKLLSENKNEYQMVLETLQEYIQYIEIKNKKIIFDNFNDKQKIEMIDSLPINLKNKIQDKIIQAISFIFETKLFDVKTFENERFNFYNLRFIEHIKMFFSYDIRSLYTELYYLASFHLPPDYILKISPSERKIYLSIIEEQQKAKENKNSKDDFAEAAVSQSVKDLALEFGDQVQ
jgi:hypothetical protein